MELTLTWAATPYEAALARPLATAAGPIAMRGGWFLTCTGDGFMGQGEAVAWPAWGTEPAEAIAAALARWPGASRAPTDLADVAAVLTGLGLARAGGPALWAGAELALLDWLAQRSGRRLADLLAGPDGAVLAEVPIAALIGADAPDDAAREAAAAVAAGHGTVKLKVGDPDGLARAQAVRAAIGPDVALRLDANGGWPDAAAAMRALDALAPLRPAFVEQPVPAADLAGLASLAASSSVPIAADEALGQPGAAARLLAAGVPVLVVKPAVHGGLLHAQALIRQARAAGATVVLSSALDRGVASAGVWHLAAATQGLPPAGLGTAAWWADGGVVPAMRPVAGVLRLPAAPSPPRPPVVALWAHNSDAWVQAALAAWHAGEAVLPLPPRATDAEVAELVARARPRCLLAAPELLARAQALGVPVAALVPRDVPWQLPAGDFTAAIVPTSGTTGRPKLAMLGMAGLRETARLTAAALGLGPGDTYALPLPLHHVGGLGALARCAHAGARLALLDGAYEPERLRVLLAGATHASLVPTQLADLGTLPATLRVAMVGGAALPPDLAARCPAARPTYGLTEAGGTVTLGADQAPLPGWALRLDADGQILVRGPGVMTGYLDDPAATARVLRDGWLHTGDLGAFDAEGRLMVLARRDDMVVTGGENVYPAEVEAALLAHSAIAEAAVVAAPDPRLGQIAVAFLVARGAAPADLDASLASHLAARLARAKHPRAVVWLPALPRLAAGKVDRRALREQAAAGRV